LIKENKNKSAKIFTKLSNGSFIINQTLLKL